MWLDLDVNNSYVTWWSCCCFVPELVEDVPPDSGRGGGSHEGNPGEPQVWQLLVNRPEVGNWDTQCAFSMRADLICERRSSLSDWASPAWHRAACRGWCRSPLPTWETRCHYAIIDIHKILPGVHWAAWPSWWRPRMPLLAWNWNWSYSSRS